jgi:hypothetical protein
MSRHRDRIAQLEATLPDHLDAACCVESQTVKHYLTREGDPNRPELPSLDGPCLKTDGPRCTRGLELCALWRERLDRVALTTSGLDESEL